jgi:anthranilate phosphoribosyltransferase
VIKEGINKLVQKVDLSGDEAYKIMTEIMLGEATPAQIGAFLAAIRMKGETVDEVTAFATAMRRFCSVIKPKVKGRLVDTCGTGGDKIKTFNVSTISAFVVAGAGIAVAKHGNRSVTSKCGSADVLESLGFSLELSPVDVERLIEDVGIGFMFAPRFHPAMKYVIGSRREIGIRTVFNILGPLTNPAGADAQVLGVYSQEWLEPLAQVLGRLGCKEAMVVNSEDELDEISILGPTVITRLRNSEVRTTTIKPRDFGFKIASPDEIQGSTPEESAELTFSLLYGLLDSEDPRRNMVLLNAAAGIVVGGKANNIVEGIDLAAESIESGSAYNKLKMMIKASHGQMIKLEGLERKHG